MITINIQGEKPVDYTQAVLFKLEEISTLLSYAKEDVEKECPYDVEHELFHIKRSLREACEMVNKVADYYEVASEPRPKKEDIVLTKPLEPRT